MIAADIMTRDVVTVRDSSPLIEAVRLMVDRHISGVPVLNAAGGFVGMLTEGDLLRRVETGTETHPAWLTELLRPDHVAEAFVKANGREVSEVMEQDIGSWPVLVIMLRAESAARAGRGWPGHTSDA